MKLVITCKPDPLIRIFIFDFLPHFILERYHETVEPKKLEPFSEGLKIDCFEGLSVALDNIIIKDAGENNFEYSFPSNKYYGGFKLDDLVQFITYGNLSIKGYPIIEEILKYVSYNINSIFTKWRKAK